jgi:ATP-dependent DNA helicase RecG
LERKEELREFTIVFHKDIFNEEELSKRGLKERYIKAVRYVKEKGKITNREYKELSNISRQMATIFLSQLVEKEILIMKGKTGKGNCLSIDKIG